MSNIMDDFAGCRPPPAADAVQARRGIERWRAAIAGLNDPSLWRAADRLLSDEAAIRLLSGVFGNSPFLTLMAELEPAFVVNLLCDGLDPAWHLIMRDIADAKRRALEGGDPARALRAAKRRVALATGIADIAGLWTLEQVLEALSDFAESALDPALAFLLRETARRGAIPLAEGDDPERRSGLSVLGMGKLGARELNYSSDIDLIVFYDPERFRTAMPDALAREAVRLTRGLVRVIADRTTDGYVFRTDLRLRPDPGATPIAVSVLAAEEYYETLGQNWERAALIKARPVAGDRQAGAAFLG